MSEQEGHLYSWWTGAGFCTHTAHMHTNTAWEELNNTSLKASVFLSTYPNVGQSVGATFLSVKVSSVLGDFINSCCCIMWWYFLAVKLKQTYSFSCLFDGAAFFMPTNDRKVNMSQTQNTVWRRDGVQLSYVDAAVYQTKHSANIFPLQIFQFRLRSWVSAPAVTQHRSDASCREIHISHLSCRRNRTNKM